MKILILANYDVGLYNFRKELIEKLIQNGNQVYISLPYGPKVELLKSMGCEFIDTQMDRRGTNPFKDIKLMLQYCMLIKNIKPDCVLTYTIKPNIYGGLACRLRKVKYISTITGLGSAFQKPGSARALVTFLYKLSLKKANNVIFENTNNQDIFVTRKIIQKNQAVLVNGAGVNIDEFHFAPLPNDLKIKFLYLGRIMKEKGVDELFQAAEQIRSEYKNVEFEVLGFFEGNYKQIVENLHERGIIKYEGFQSNVKNFIINSHCTILPSYHEGLSNTLLESAAMGRPLITSDIPGCRETVVANESGFLCQPQNSEELYHAIKRFILLAHDKKQEMGKKARRHIEMKFDRKEVVKQILSLVYNE